MARNFAEARYDDVILNSIEFGGRGGERRVGVGARLVIERKAEEVSTSGWNRTHAMPSGGVLVWTAPVKRAILVPPGSIDDGGGASGIYNVAGPCEHTVSLTGPLLVITNGFPGNFHHFLHDTVPILFFVAKFRAGPNARFGIIDHPLHRQLLGWLAPDLAKRVEWLPQGNPKPATVCFTDGRTEIPTTGEEVAASRALALASGAVPMTRFNHGDEPALVAVQFKHGVEPNRFTANMPAAVADASAAVAALGVPMEVDSGWSDKLQNPHLSRLMALEIGRLRPKSAPILEPHPIAGHPGEQPVVDCPGGDHDDAPGRRRFVVFCRRSSDGIHQRRAMTDAHESRLVETIAAVMAEFGRPERLVVFNGEDARGRALTFAQQYGVFRDASLVIGPHGAGLANLAWLRPSAETCSKGPAVLEFVCARDAASVQPECPWKTNGPLLGGLLWVRYFHLLLARNSTVAAGHLFVDPDKLAFALRSIFSEQDHVSVPFPSSVDASVVLGTATDPLPMLVASGSLPMPNEVPYFFHAPITAGTSVERILSTKRKMKTLPSGNVEDLAYLERSQAIRRKVVSYLKTPLFFHACAMLGRSKLKARAFTILREPVGRIVSLFWYQKDLTWETSVIPASRNQSVELYLQAYLQGGAEHNWLLSTLAAAAVPRNRAGQFLASNGEVFAAARFVLLERLEVGFSDDMEHSMAMIFASFGWVWTPGDVEKMSRNVNFRDRAGAVPPTGNYEYSLSLPTAQDEEEAIDREDSLPLPTAQVEEAMAVFLPRIAELNKHDVALYQEARRRYDLRKAVLEADAVAGDIQALVQSKGTPRLSVNGKTTKGVTGLPGDPPADEAPDVSKMPFAAEWGHIKARQAQIALIATTREARERATAGALSVVPASAPAAADGEQNRKGSGDSSGVGSGGGSGGGSGNGSGGGSGKGTNGLAVVAVVDRVSTNLLRYERVGAADGESGGAPVEPKAGFAGEVNRLAEGSLAAAKLQQQRLSTPAWAGHVLCEDIAPKLLTATASAVDVRPQEAGPRHDAASLAGYADYYTKVLDRFARLRSEFGDVTLNSIEVSGQEGGGARLVIEGRGDVISCSGWNGTRSIPEDPAGKRSSGALVWTRPPTLGPEAGEGPPTTDEGSYASGKRGRSAERNRAYSAAGPCEHTVSLTGPLLVIANWFPGNFHHFLHDTVPILFFVTKFRAGPRARFGLIDHPLHRRMLGWLAPDLAKRVEWLPQRSSKPVMICFTDGSLSSSGGGKAALLSPSIEEAEAANALFLASGGVPLTRYAHGEGPALVAVQFKSGVLSNKGGEKATPAALAAAAFDAVRGGGAKLSSSVDSASAFNLRNPALSRLMALEIARLNPEPGPSAPPHPLTSGLHTLISGGASRGSGGGGGNGSDSSSGAQPHQRSIVFYRRASNGTLHGRTMDLAHEALLYRTILAVMAEFERPEKLVIFNGEDARGRALTFAQQYGVFRDASLVIGPHGAGLANLVWMPPSPDSCDQGPAVLEFICSKETSSVQLGCPGKSHWSLLGGVPWVRYHHLLLAKNSTGAAGQLWVEPDELDAALRRIFKEQPHVSVPFPSSVDATSVMGTLSDPLPMLVPSRSSPSPREVPYFFHVPKAAGTDHATSVMGTLSDPLPMLVPSRSSPSPSEVPYFFHVPKAAGTSVERILATKRKMKTLPSGDVEDLAYVERSQALTRNIIAYVKTPLFFHACAMLGRSKLKARAFTILREPVGRIVSLFWYKKDSTWEKSFDPKYRNQSLEVFLRDAERDWLVFTLASAVVPRDALVGGHFLASSEDVFAAARFVLLERLEVGFMDDMEQSMAMIFAAFGWDWTPGDVEKLSRNVNDRAKAEVVVEPSSPPGKAAAPPAAKAAAKAAKKKDDPLAAFLPRIAELNKLDVELYQEARRRYDLRKIGRF